MFEHTPEDQRWLHKKWQSLAYPLAQHLSAADTTWGALIEHYSEPHRAYHNLSHIIALLRHADAERTYIKQPEDVVEFAIWFHDVIYQTQAKDNEECSAAWARNAMHDMGIDASLIASVEQCIIATQHHQIIAPQIADLPVFLDMDLAILGSDAQTYRRYSQAVRAEYAWVPHDAYRTGRSAILKNFIERPALFYTPRMAAHLEVRARQNIDSELRELSSVQTRS
jgi:predicted metal-dependent HD superfamily phosphohydrolase